MTPLAVDSPVIDTQTHFLPAEARNSIGKVGRETEPVLHMLKKIGFEYKNQVDPFDGGPHLWANIEDILPIKKIKIYAYDPRIEIQENDLTESGLITKTSQRTGEFRAAGVKAKIEGERIGFTTPDGAPDAQLEEAIGLEAGGAVAFMPYY